MAQAEIDKIKAQIDSEVLRMRDLNIFICNRFCTEPQLKAFTKTYAEISMNVDILDNQIFKINQKGK